MTYLLYSTFILSQIALGTNGYSWFSSNPKQFEWEEPRGMSQPESHCKNPGITLSNSGKAAAVWLQWDGTQNVVYGSEKTQVGWSDSKCISLSEGEHYQLELDSNKEGQSIAIWIAKRDHGYAVESAAFDEIWMPTIVLSKSTGRSFHPKISINKAGDGVAVWVEDSKEGFLIKASIFTMKQWSEPKVLSKSKAINLYPSLDFNANGEALVAWHSIDQAKSTIEATFYRNGTWTKPTSISPSKTQALEPNVSFNECGYATVVWTGKEKESTFIQGADYIAGKWKFFGDLSERKNQNTLPQVVNVCSKNKIVIWQRSNTKDHREICARIFNGVKWEPVAILSDSSHFAKSPKLCVNELGSAVVLWQNRKEVHEPLFVSTLASGNWTHPKKVPLNQSLHSSEPNIALNEHGEIAIIRIGSSTDPLVIGTVDLQEGEID